MGVSTPSAAATTTFTPNSTPSRPIFSSPPAKAPRSKNPPNPPPPATAAAPPLAPATPPTPSASFAVKAVKKCYVRGTKKGNQANVKPISFCLDQFCEHSSFFAMPLTDKQTRPHAPLVVGWMLPSCQLRQVLWWTEFNRDVLLGLDRSLVQQSGR